MAVKRSLFYEFWRNNDFNKQFLPLAERKAFSYCELNSEKKRPARIPSKICSLTPMTSIRSMYSPSHMFDSECKQRVNHGGFFFCTYLFAEERCFSQQWRQSYSRRASDGCSREINKQINGHMRRERIMI